MSNKTWSLISVSDAYYIRSSKGDAVLISFDLNSLVHKNGATGVSKKHVGPKAYKAAVNILRAVGVEMEPKAADRTLPVEDISETYYTERVLITPAPVAAPAPVEEEPVEEEGIDPFIYTFFYAMSPLVSNAMLFTNPTPAVENLRWFILSLRAMRFQAEDGTICHIDNDRQVVEIDGVEFHSPRLVKAILRSAYFNQ